MPELIKDVPKWVAIVYLVLGKLDLWIYDIGWALENYSYKIGMLRERIRDKYCSCVQCKEKKK